MTLDTIIEKLQARKAIMFSQDPLLHNQSWYISGRKEAVRDVYVLGYYLYLLSNIEIKTDEEKYKVEMIEGEFCQYIDNVIFHKYPRRPIFFSSYKHQNRYYLKFSAHNLQCYLEFAAKYYLEWAGDCGDQEFVEAAQAMAKLKAMRISNQGDTQKNVSNLRNNLFIDAVKAKNFISAAGFIECGVDIHYVHFYNVVRTKNALISAIENDDIEMVMLLLGAGANVNECGDYNAGALYHACKANVSCELNESTLFHELKLASKLGRVEVICLLMDANKNMDVKIKQKALAHCGFKYSENNICNQEKSSIAMKLK